VKRVSTTRLRKIIARLRGRRILVVGDLILDSYIWGNVQRISPEAPVPVVDVTRESEGLGGAANVAENIVALGGQPVMVGVVGEDSVGQYFRTLLKKHGIAPRGVLVDKTRPTTRKTRIIAQSQQVVRVDREVRKPLNSRIRQRLLAQVKRLLTKSEILLLSDYGKGIFEPEIITALIAMAQAHDIPVFVDPKIEHFRQYVGATVMTPNLHELAGGTGQLLPDDQQQRDVGRRVRRELELDALLVTRGAEGMLLLEQKKRAVQIPTMARKVFDVTGAGDTVISTLALARAAGASFLESAVLANHAAGLVVGRVGASTVTPGELREVV